ncbi:hypothetical protein D4T97_008205 [Siminovitchia acidinfaciens]|uniref:Uncharacterized protein n=1 Tax=Siminovitchia acidinfaciens TaxID=2321395 RepID=A0A429Y1Z1_9BACI|nr:hypothetical protein D4T97_008205 [Siminovitchia acidinfaciens]
MRLRKILIGLIVLFFIISFYLNLLGLMQLVPIYITSPLLFISIFIFFSFINGRNKFKGFH